MHQIPEACARVMEFDTSTLTGSLNLIAAAIDSLCVTLDDHNRRVEHLLKEIDTSIGYIQLECGQ